MLSPISNATQFPACHASEWLFAHAFIGSLRNSDFFEEAKIDVKVRNGSAVETLRQVRSVIRLKPTIIDDIPRGIFMDNRYPELIGSICFPEKRRPMRPPKHKKIWESAYSCQRKIRVQNLVEEVIGESCARTHQQLIDQDKNYSQLVNMV